MENEPNNKKLESQKITGIRRMVEDGQDIFKGAESMGGAPLRSEVSNDQEDRDE